MSLKGGREGNQQSWNHICKDMREWYAWMSSGYFGVSRVKNAYGKVLRMGLEKKAETRLCQAICAMLSSGVSLS